MKGPPLLPAAKALKGPALTAFRQARNLSTAHMAQAVNKSRRIKVGKLGCRPSQPCSRMLLCRHRGSRGHVLESRRADRGARDHGRAAQGSSLLCDLLGLKESSPAVLSSDRCCTGSEAKGSQDKGLCRRQARGKLGEGRVHWTEALRAPRGTRGNRFGSHHCSDLWDPCFCWWSDVKKMEQRTNNVALLSMLTPKLEETRYRKRSSFSACSCPGVDYQVPNSKPERARSSCAADTHPKVKVQ